MVLGCDLPSCLVKAPFHWNMGLGMFWDQWDVFFFPTVGSCTCVSGDMCWVGCLVVGFGAAENGCEGWFMIWMDGWVDGSLARVVELGYLI